MKTKSGIISILGILAILVMVGEFVYTFSIGLQDFSDGFNEGYDRGRAKQEQAATESGEDSNEEAYKTLYVHVRPAEGVPADTLLNVNTGSYSPYQVSTIRTRFIPSAASDVLMVLLGISGIIAATGIIFLIRVLLNISKGRVFVKTNVRSLRFFSYSLALMMFLVQANEWLDYLVAGQQLYLSGYELLPPATNDFTSLIIILLLTEIFAVSVKIKEEQDLTI
ncbi:MAG: DUF2975 domain-containing protein [Bacteroides sp.]|nr:DUF2975 domain-containing protein [Bacteroides sp.]